MKKDVIFNTERSPILIVSDILKKYEIGESIEEIILNLEEDKKSRVVFVILGLKDLFFGKIKEEEFLSLFQKKLKTDLKTTKSILEDLKEKLPYSIKEIFIKNRKEKTKKKQSSIDLLTPAVALGIETEE